MQWATAVGLDKNVTENREQRTDNRESSYRGPSNHQWNGGLSGAIDITAFIFER